MRYGIALKTFGLIVGGQRHEVKPGELVGLPDAAAETLTVAGKLFTVGEGWFRTIDFATAILDGTVIGIQDRRGGAFTSFAEPEAETPTPELPKVDTGACRLDPPACGRPYTMKLHPPTRRLAPWCRVGRAFCHVAEEKRADGKGPLPDSEARQNVRGGDS